MNQKTFQENDKYRAMRVKAQQEIIELGRLGNIKDTSIIKKLEYMDLSEFSNSREVVDYLLCVRN